MSEDIPSISLDALVAASSKNKGDSIDTDALYDLAQKYFAEHPEVPLVDKTKTGIINTYLQELAQQKSQTSSRNQTSLAEEGQSSTSSQRQSSDDLFSTLFEALMRATICEAMHHDFHHACPYGRFSHLSFGLPPRMADCHSHFCHRVDAHEVGNRLKTRMGSYDVGRGVAEMIKGNGASGFAEVLSGGFKIASVALDKKRGR